MTISSFNRKTLNIGGKDKIFNNLDVMFEMFPFFKIIRARTYFTIEEHIITVP